MKNWKSLAGFLLLLAIVVATAIYEPESIYYLMNLFLVIGLFADNHRLRKKLAELGHPDDIKSRIEAQKASQK